MMSCSCPSSTAVDTTRHPCYSSEAQHKFARLHLPVAPRCNISCNYCNRKYDCVNESRPGVTSEVLSPLAAKKKFDWVKSEVENLAVVGIAGPGDALANWEETCETILRIREDNKDIIFCLSTNGLMLPRYAKDIVDLGVRHVTVTLNTIDPVIGARLYRQVSFEGVTYTGVEGASLLLKNQLEGIAQLVRAGVLVKINIVMVTGINDRHIPEVVKKVKELGVFVTNIMPMIAAPGCAFEHIAPTSMKEVNAMRDLCQLDIRQMRHCRQCRADAVGLLGDDRSAEFSGCHAKPPKGKPAAKTYKIAVASKHGKLVDLHFGHATRFIIYQVEGDSYQILEVREVGQYCIGADECQTPEDNKTAVINALSDCDACVTMRIGYHAQQNLTKRGVKSIECCYTVEHGIKMAVVELEKQTA